MFPHASDGWDVMAWEATALDLLQSVGIRTPERRLTKVGGRSVLVLRRFDRSASGDRIGYISALTATGSVDGEHRDYADVADAIRDLSVSARADHRELFDRVVASVALGNTDDHLRNHGFLASQGSWMLSPAFDVNPSPDLQRRRSTSIMGADTVVDEVDGLRALADRCDLKADHAFERMAAIAAGMADWRAAAQRNRIPEAEIAMMAEAIEPRREALAGARARFAR